MFCGRCGTPIPANASFCPRCGNAVVVAQRSVPLPAILTTIATPTTAAIQDITGSATAPSQRGLTSTAPLDSPSPTYAVFALQILSIALLGSIQVFDIADDAARGHWTSTLSSAVAATILLFLVQRAITSWAKFRKAVCENTGAYPRKILSRGIVFALLFMSTAGIVGNAIGRSGQETAQMTSDFHEMSIVGDRISHARNAVERTVPAHIEMYKAIETDVQEFDNVLRRLRTELDVYDGKFPSQHDGTTKSIHSIEVGIRRSSLIKKQIEVAREIEALDPATQWDAWQQKMQPLLAE